MTVKRDCSGSTWVIGADGLGRDCPCTHPATIKHSDGQWYCQEHDPDRGRKAMANRRAIRQLRARNARLAALVTPKLAELLERLGTAWTAKLSDKAYALTLAARIREALALEANDES